MKPYIYAFIKQLQDPSVVALVSLLCFDLLCFALVVFWLFFEKVKTIFQHYC